MKALVLSGGSIKGAFQAGAIAQILEDGYVPEIIYGISIGALNGGFLVDRAGRAEAAGQSPDWPKIGQELEAFWRANIVGPSSVIEHKSALTIGGDVVNGKFDGIVGTKAAQNLIRKNIIADNLRATAIKYFCGAVNLASGGIVYADPDYSDIVDYIIASTAEPITMPLKDIGGGPFCDGGIRDIAPLGKAIGAGATDIQCILCQADELTARDFNRGNILDLIGRAMDIVTNEILKNDLKQTQFVNELLQDQAQASKPISRPLSARRVVDVHIIRPKAPISVHVDKFTSADIDEMIKTGRHSAKRGGG